VTTASDLSSSEREESWTVDAFEANRRLDVVLSTHLTDVSRAQAKRWIEERRVRLDGKLARASRTCREGERIEVRVPPLEPAEPEPENVPLSILYEDRHLVVVDKRAGMVVHPSPGHPKGTLVHALLAHTRDLSGIGGVLRPGIVHRLDAGTSGVLVVAKHDRAHRRLSEQFQNRSVSKLYVGLVHGSPPERFTVDSPIGRDPRNRTRMSSRSGSGRDALTEMASVERLPLSTLLEIRIRTGRTHQIRVHLSEAGYPIVGDRDYGAPRLKSKLPSHHRAAFRLLRDFPRPALHAARLSFDHPETGERVSFEAPLPEDFEVLLDRLRGIRDLPCES
jgi:23S rRNA pseudouridine1911/1915/1917 synthase